MPGLLTARAGFEHFEWVLLRFVVLGEPLAIGQVITFAAQFDHVQPFGQREVIGIVPGLERLARFEFDFYKALDLVFDNGDQRHAEGPISGWVVL